MVKHKQWLALFLIAAVICLALVGCNQDTPTTETPTTPTATSTPTAEPTTEVPAEAVLVVTKGDKSVSYTLAELQAMPVADGDAGLMTSTGDIIGPFPYKGVALLSLLDAVGGLTEDDMVRVEAKDGYAMTFSYDHIMNANFPTFKASDGSEVDASGLEVVLAYEEDGLPLGESAGPLRTVIYSGPDVVTEGHWWIKWVTKIDVVPAQVPFTLSLEGAINEEIDSNSFESCAAPGCHGLEWTDAQGRTWEGIALYLLVGRVDDEISHDGPAFNDALADAGYSVVLEAVDGYKVTFDAAAVKRNKDLIISFQRDGMALPENQWPLRLVGPDLEKAQMIGQIAKISIVSE